MNLQPRPAPNAAQVAEILSRAAFQEFVGLEEGDEFEVKGEVYDLTRANDRYELSKDVAGLANGLGGYLLIGLQHDRIPTASIDFVSGLSLVAEASFDVGQYGGVIRENVFPQVKELEVSWLSGATDEGLGVIHVPPQPEDLRPFLVARLVEDDEPVKQIVFGLPYRSFGDTTPLSKQQLHEYVRRGMRSQMQRLVAIEEKLDFLLEAQAASRAEATGTTLADRLNDITEDA